MLSRAVWLSPFGPCARQRDVLREAYGSGQGRISVGHFCRTEVRAIQPETETEVSP